ncbi:PepSY domain-containing protein [Parashewanella spongiae]|uniref:PepSY domain-containing protein n=1 Tax=Parashewanella spongiae TaxID=342950 RepID=A0A3A6TZD8_9GAMM|nr:PepSY domain-containing protein [Parashewanella spongiae]MCL1076697.1 PepSY domain-containing protein [Parashewanella spongiae]RJY18505.1 PepSY domain-containing protein [Parashewanella spongiae]
MSHKQHRVGKKRNKKLNRKLMRGLKSLHHKLGLVCATFIIIISVTGLAINHTKEFDLAQTPVTQEWLLDIYKIKAPNQLLTHSIQKQTVTIADNLVWLNDHFILEADSRLTMAAITHDYIVVANKNQLYVLNKIGELQETQDLSTGLPTPVDAMAIDENNTLWIRSNETHYQSDADMIDWYLGQPKAPLAWINLTESTKPELVLQARSIHLNWQKVILDLHSGQLLGVFGKFLWDLVAFCLIFLAVSGMTLYLRNSKSKK